MPWLLRRLVVWRGVRCQGFLGLLRNPTRGKPARHIKPALHSKHACHIKPGLHSKHACHIKPGLHSKHACHIKPALHSKGACHIELTLHSKPACHGKPAWALLSDGSQNAIDVCTYTVRGSPTYLPLLLSSNERVKYWVLKMFFTPTATFKSDSCGPKSYAARLLNSM